MATYNKQPLDVSSQLRHIQRKGLMVGNIPQAQLYLARVSFYRFKGYAHQFKSKRGQYVGATFEDICLLMELDEALRLHVLKGIQTLEISLRTTINEHMTLKYHAHWYADPDCLPRDRLINGKKQRMVTCTEEIAPRAYAEFLRSHENFPRYYRQHYDMWVLPPSWMATEVMSFGVWSKI